MNRFKNSLLALTAAVSMYAGSVAADVIVPVVARVPGANSTVWRSDLKMVNSLDKTISGTIIHTPRGLSQQSTDKITPFTISSGGVYFTSDPTEGIDTAERLRIVMDNDTTTGLPFPDPIVQASVYNKLSNGGELGQLVTVHSQNDYTSAGNTLVMIAGKDGQRTNAFIETGPESENTIRYRIIQNGKTVAETNMALGQNATHQFSPLYAFTGHAPMANEVIEVDVINGSARAAISPVDNTTGQGYWVDAKAKPTVDRLAVAYAFVNHWLPRTDSKFYLRGHPGIEWIVAARFGLWKSGKGAHPTTAFPTFPQALPRATRGV